MIITVTLGDFIFDHVEVPENINGGGAQATAVHQLVGGLRTVDGIGRNDSDITFSGLFQGLTAVERARYIDNLRVEGKPLTFSYASFSYTVLIKNFDFKYQIADNVSYTITLIVIKDLTSPITFALPSLFADILIEALEEALDLATFVNDGGVSGALGELSIAINGIGDLNNMTAAEISSLTSQVSGAVNAVDNAISNTNI